MTDSYAGFIATRLDGVRRSIPSPPKMPFAPAMRRGTMLAGLYAPKDRDEQEPHDQDELYVVVRGSGRFVQGEARVLFGPGDLLFVAAGLPHRFEDFTQDLLVWAIFYGPPGGENPSSA